MAGGAPVRTDVRDAQSALHLAAPSDSEQVLREHGAAVKVAGFDGDIEQEPNTHHLPEEKPGRAF